MRDALKVAFVLPSLSGGGAERAAVTLLNALLSQGHDLTLYVFSREGPYFDLLDPRIRVVVGRKGRVGRLMALRRFIAAERPDVAVSFLSHFSVYAAVRAARVRTRFMISLQTPVSAFLQDADYHWRWPLNRRLFVAVARALYPRADLIAAASQGVADDLVNCYGVSRRRIEVVPNPVDVEAVERRSLESVDGASPGDGVPTIVTAGRLADAKNLPLMVASLQALAARVPFRAWILGQGDRESDLRRMLAEAGLTERVQLLGFQENPWKFMARADVFLLTSRYEGFGNVLIEAMAAGLPVVATASYGTRDIVQHKKTGLLVEAHEAKEVAGALEEILTDREARRRYSAAARAAALAYSVRTIAGRFAEAMQVATETNV